MPPSSSPSREHHGIEWESLTAAHHGGLSALFIAVLVRLFPLEAPVSDYLADQVAGIAGMDFHRTLVNSLVCAWVLFLFFLFVAAAAARKSLGKRHRSVL